MSDLVSQVFSLCAYLKRACVRGGDLARDISAVVAACGPEIRADLEDEAERLYDNLTPEVALYTWLGDLTRGLEPLMQHTTDVHTIARFSKFRVAVMGD